MRFLKNKIARARESSLLFAQKNAPNEAQIPAAPTTELPRFKVEIKQEERISFRTEPSPPQRSMRTRFGPVVHRREAISNKNIVKNYSRAMVNFALSNMAVVYLEKIIKNEPAFNMEGFKKFMEEQREEITSIKRLRDILMLCREDGQQLISYKRVFKALSLVFIKKFSVNWIYSSKIADKLIHVKYRFKMLRRVQNPEYFTYLEDFAHK